MLLLRFNDAKCDAHGRLWAGTIHDEDATSNRKSKGNLYMFTKGDELLAIYIT